MNTSSVWNRKKYQRAVNRIVREANKNIKNDWLWDGRFTVSQVAAYFTPFIDKSGAMFQFILECKDNKTKDTRMHWFDNFNIDHHLYPWINKCITEEFQVWNEKPGPYEQANAEGRFLK